MFSSLVPIRLCLADFSCDDDTRPVDAKSQHCCHIDLNGPELAGTSTSAHRCRDNAPRAKEIHMRSSVIACAAGLLAAELLALGCAPADAQVFRPPPATSRSRPSRAGSPTLGHSRSCPTAGCWSPSGRAACASSARTASCRRRLPGVPKSFAVGPGRPASTSCSTATMRRTNTIYFCFAEPASGGARTSLARARLVDEGTPRLDDVKVIFRQEGPLVGRQPFRLPHRAGAATATCS